MFNKLHMQLTFLCMLVTGTILIGLSVICLNISENGYKQNSEVAFYNQLSSIISYLEIQNEISYEWIANTLNNKQLILNIEDGGIPLILTKITQSEEDALLVSQAKEIALIQYDLDMSNTSDPIVSTEHVEFILTDNHHQDYKASTIIIPKKKGNLSVVFLYSLQGLNKQIITQRAIFFTLDIVALLLLASFFFVFTGKMIQPIEASRKKQIEFVAKASHELRTPLMVIQSSLSAMKQADSVQAEQFSNTIHMESQRMTHLVNDMLTLARADNSSWNIQLKAAELDTLLVMIYEKYEQIALDKKITLSFELPNELLNKYPCDVMRIEQVFIILIDNALCYTPMGGNIKLIMFTTHDKLEIRFADNGPGVPDDEKENIFERFYRAEHNYSEKEHFGLGLCIAKEIVNLHKGKLYVEDTPGGGATFIISLPLHTS